MRVGERSRGKVNGEGNLSGTPKLLTCCLSRVYYDQILGLKSRL